MSIFTGHLRLLSRALQWLVILSLLVTAFPLALNNPGWYLRIGDTAVSNSPVLLLAILTLILEHVFLSNDENPNEIIQITDRLTGIWALVFALVVPLQLIAYGWLWVASGSQLKSQLKAAETKMATVRSQIRGSRNEADLRRILTATNNGNAPSLEPSSLSDQKQRIDQSINLKLMNLRSDLNARRNEILAGTIPGVIKTAIGAVIVSTTLLTIKREL